LASSGVATPASRAFAEGIVPPPGRQVHDQHLGRVVLDLSLVQGSVVLGRLAAGRIEDLLLQQGVDRQVLADLLDDLSLAGLVGLLEFLEELLDPPVVGLQEFDRIELDLHRGVGLLGLAAVLLLLVFAGAVRRRVVLSHLHLHKAPPVAAGCSVQVSAGR
jgi:hypothetical protein